MQTFIPFKQCLTYSALTTSFIHYELTARILSDLHAGSTPKLDILGFIPNHIITQCAHAPSVSITSIIVTITYVRRYHISDTASVALNQLFILSLTALVSWPNNVDDRNDPPNVVRRAGNEIRPAA